MMLQINLWLFHSPSSVHSCWKSQRKSRCQTDCFQKEEFLCGRSSAVEPKPKCVTLLCLSCVSDCPLCPHMNGHWQLRHSMAPPTSLVFLWSVNTVLAGTTNWHQQDQPVREPRGNSCRGGIQQRSLNPLCGWKWPHQNWSSRKLSSLPASRLNKLGTSRPKHPW